VLQAEELLLGHIIHRNLPFTNFECPYMQKFLKLSDSELAGQLSIQRTSLQTRLHTSFHAKQQEIKTDLANSLTRVHLSFDMWTSPANQLFLAVFGHYINSAAICRNRLLAFRLQGGTHTGEHIGNTLHEVVTAWGISSNVGASVCDNASNNDTCVRSLYPRLDPSMTHKDIKACRLRCFGHILNLAAQAFLFGEDAAAFELDAGAYDLQQRYEEDLQHWRRKGSIGKLHNIVKYIRSSPQRAEAFRKHANDFEATDFHRLSSDVPSTASLNLIANNKTRWNSTYLMIDRAIRKRNELNSYLMSFDFEPEQSRPPGEDMLVTEDWKVLIELRDILQPLYNLTMKTQAASEEGGRLHDVLSGMEFVLQHFESWKTLYDSDLTVFPSPIELTPPLERRTTRLSRLHDRRVQRFNEDVLPSHVRNEYISLPAENGMARMATESRASIRTSINHAWSKLEEYYTLLDDSPLWTAAVILNPNQGIKWLRRTWRDEAQQPWLVTATDGLKSYLDRWYSDNVNQPQSSPILRQVRPQRERDMYEEFMHMSTDDEEEGSELERYYNLKPPREKVKPIEWWIARKTEFQRLSALALDVLAIPAMSADCERAFSNAKFTVTSQRHATDAKTVEELQLMKNWLRSGTVVLGGMKEFQ